MCILLQSSSMRVIVSDIDGVAHAHMFPLYALEHCARENPLRNSYCIGGETIFLWIVKHG